MAYIGSVVPFALEAAGEPVHVQELVMVNDPVSMIVTLWLCSQR